MPLDTNMTPAEMRAALHAPRSTAKLAEALAIAQGQMHNPIRDREVLVKSKTTNTQYTFSYATMASILDAIRQPLADNGLWFTHTLEQMQDGKYRLVTTLLHSSGESISSHTPLFVEGGGNQAFGSALTYMRRYALCALLGIAADDDDDGNAADDNKVQASRNRAKKKADPSQAQEGNAELDDRFRQTVGQAPIKPHAIEVPQPGPDNDMEKVWRAWSTRFCREMNTAASAENVAAWQNENQAQLDSLANAKSGDRCYGKELRDYVQKQMDNRRHLLVSAP